MLEQQIKIFLLTIWMVTFAPLKGYCACDCTPVAGEGNYYVDKDGLCGPCDDSRDRAQNGITAPWCSIQRAADLAASGDTIHVRAGTYYESVILTQSGTSNSPITFKPYCEDEVVVDGSRVLTGWAPCASANDCEGSAVWNQLYYTFIPADVASTVSPLTANLHENDAFMWIAQEPDQPDPFYLDDIAYFFTIPCQDMTQTSITDATQLTQSDPNYYSDAYVLPWVSHYRVNYRKILSFIPSEHRITFDAAVNPPYTDRDEKYSLINHMDFIDQPGEYLIKIPLESDGTRKIYIWPYAPANIHTSEFTVSVRNFGFDINNQSYITLKNFKIRKFYGTDLRDGLGIGSMHTGTAIYGITIENNQILHNCHEESGYGGIYLQSCHDCVVEGNVLDSLMRTKGIFLNSTTGSIVKNNEIRRPGSTAITFYDAQQSRIIYNTIDDCNGSHANGITTYLGCSQVLIAGNRISNTLSPIVLQDSSDLYYYNNIVDSGGKDCRVNEWSGNSGGTIAFLNNTLVNNSANVALNIGGYGADYIVKNNIIDGFCPKAGTIISHNLYTGLMWCQKDTYGWTLEEGGVIEADTELIFQDAASGNFTLKCEGPAVNSGVDITGHLPMAEFPDFDFFTDIDGNRRPAAGIWDMGACEFRQGNSLSMLILLLLN